MITTNRLYALCNRENWFTGGSNDKYDKLFYLAEKGREIKELALVIWLCSPGKTYGKIKAVLDQEFAEEIDNG